MLKRLFLLILLSLNLISCSQKTEEVITLAAPISLLHAAESVPSPQPATPQATNDKNVISIIGVGDIMIGSNYPAEKYLPPNDGKDVLRDVQQLLSDADITFGNLEGCILDSGGVSAKVGCKMCFAFRMPEKYAANLKPAGFDILNIANNHIRDFGKTGTDNTLKILKEWGIHTAGLENVPSVTFEKNGIKYGFTGFAPNHGTNSINDIAQAQQTVRDLKKVSDIVIVSFHGGAEGSAYQHVTRKSESFYGETRGNVYEFAHAVIDAGADVVFGHGPHVTRAVEIYKDRFIAYSLGNFATYGLFGLKGPTQLAPLLKVFVDKQGKFVNADITPIIQLGKGIPTVDPQKRVISLMRELTQADFPDAKLKIDDKGHISRL
jgi:poly-gamma-glutamate capsule biosynthesis protein CapA/YwtB (metallophosphatase superfamily)